LLKNGRIIKSSTPEELISSVTDKIFEVKSSEYTAISSLTKKYPKGNIHQGSDGLTFRIVSEECPDNFKKSTREADMEDVYMYYFKD
jgi:hypothetical protein